MYNLLWSITLSGSRRLGLDAYKSSLTWEAFERIVGWYFLRIFLGQQTHKILTKALKKKWERKNNSSENWIQNILSFLLSTFPFHRIFFPWLYICVVEFVYHWKMKIVMKRGNQQSHIVCEETATIVSWNYAKFIHPLVAVSVLKSTF